MRSSCMRWRLLAAGLPVLVGAAWPGDAIAVNWTNASGANSSFSWSGGFNNTGLFGDPTVTPGGFFFNNTNNFIAQGGGGLGDSATDFARTTVDVAGSVPAGAPEIHFIQVVEFGTWSHTISQETDFTVQADFAVFRFNPGPVGSTFSLPMSTTFFPDGTWVSERTLTAGEVGNPNFADVDWRRFQITVTNTIQVDSAAPTGSYIEKTGMHIITPEPASVLFLLAAVCPVVMRRASR